MTSKPTSTSTTSTTSTHTHLMFPCPCWLAQFDRHPMFTVSQPKLFPHIPLISPTPPPPPRPHALSLARAGILQHVYFALLDCPHNISDLVWGTQSAQSNYYTSNPTGPHITHPTIIFLHLLTMVPSTSFGTSQVLPDPIFFLNESYQKIYILRIHQPNIKVVCSLENDGIRFS